MNPLPKQAILIVNAMSRSGADVFDEARDKLTAAGIELIEAHAIDEPDEMDGAVKAAIAKAPMVIVGGGDGSLSTNVDYFMGSRHGVRGAAAGHRQQLRRDAGHPATTSTARSR